MRSSSYCTAASYKIKDLTEYLITNGSEPQIFDNVVHIQKENRNVDSRNIDIFYFPFGTIIIWGAEESQEKLILEELRVFETDPADHIASDFIYFRYIENAEKTYIDEETNEIILNDHSVFTKFSMSNAFAQSVKLSILEQSVSKLLGQASPIQEELAKTGTISLSKKQISKQIGVLFSERYSINLHSDILDTPEFFWRRPSYEPLYLMTAKFQDIQLRQNVLNHRLDVIHELYSLLSNELNYKHSTRLEWVIILLIAIEVVIGLSKWF
ncbi:MAG: RMD1 family protein [Rickettsiaceae bacterium]|nr:RMD1 family protein [Rickettsiaceae bacterium]